MHEVLVNRLGGLSLPRKSVVRLTDRPDMTLDVYPGRKTTIQHYRRTIISGTLFSDIFEKKKKSKYTVAILYMYKKSTVKILITVDNFDYI